MDELWKKPSFLILICLAAVVVAIGLSTVALSGSTNCISCHSGQHPTAGFAFVAPDFLFSAPQFVNPNSTFKVKLSVVAPSRYEISSSNATIAVRGQGGLSIQEQFNKSLVLTGEVFAAEWSIDAKNSEGSIDVDLQVEYNVHHAHAEPQGYDDYVYSSNSSHRISVKKAALQLSKSQIAFVSGVNGSDTIDLVASARVENVNVTVSPNLVGLIVMNVSENVRSIEAGGHVAVSVLFNGNQSVVDNGRINFVWSDSSGSLGSSFVAVTISGSGGTASGGESLLKLEGRVSGLLSFGLLISSAGLGAVKMGKERRIRAHCAISWFLLALSLYHAVVLMVGPYSGALLGRYVVLGYMSTFMMGLSSVNGLLEKWMTKASSHRAWIWTHRVVLIVAVILAITHAVLIGTDFAPLRSLLGG